MSDVSSFVLTVIFILFLIWLISFIWSDWFRMLKQRLGRSSHSRSAQGLSNPIRNLPWMDDDDDITDPGDTTKQPLSEYSLRVIKSRADNGPPIDHYPLVDGINAIGRDLTFEPNIELITIKDDSAISRDHAYLEVKNDGTVYLMDRGSSGTRVNGQRIQPHQEVKIQVGDKLRLGNTEFELCDETKQTTHQATLSGSKFRLRIINGPGVGEKYDLDQDVILIGRDKKKCNWPLSDPKVSGQHAEIRREGNLMRIKDMASASGLYVNNTKYFQRTLVVGDKIKLGNTEIIYERANS